jgi:chaperonin GroEL
MQKKILFAKEAREKLKKGVNVIADAVSVTLGASGKNVLIGNSYTQDYNVFHLKTRVTKDGVTVAREVNLIDPAEHRGVMMLREASEKTMSHAGDGTTSTIVLARAIVNEGLALIERGANSMELKRGIDAATEDVVEQLKAMATPIGNDIEKIRQIATIAANNDTNIGNLIAEAYAKIGSDGVINIEESLSEVTEIKVTEGVKIDSGWIVPHFNTNNPRQECELNDPIILLYEKSISKIAQLKRVVEHAASTRRPLFICCNDMDGEALAFLIVNTKPMNGKLPALNGACVIKNPSFGAGRIDEMEDLAVSVGATFVSDLKGIAIEKMSLQNLGAAKKIIISKDQTIVIEGEKDGDVYDDHINNLKMNHAQSEGDDKDKLEKRIAKLTGGIAVISVGGVTEVEMKERKDRVDDSIRATKSAIAEGYLPGAGTSLIRVHERPYFQDSDFDKGRMALFCSLKSPLIQICENGGADAGDVFSKVVNAEGSVGYNAVTGKVEDLVTSGVIDPLKVVRNALINAASVAGMIITSECLIVDDY